VNHQHEIESICAEIRRVKREIKKRKKRIAQIRLEATLAVALKIDTVWNLIHLTEQARRMSVDAHLENMVEYQFARVELRELERDRARLRAESWRMLRFAIHEAFRRSK
jgi:hypothetical protein